MISSGPAVLPVGMVLHSLWRLRGEVTARCAGAGTGTAPEACKVTWQCMAGVHAGARGARQGARAVCGHLERRHGGVRGGRRVGLQGLPGGGCGRRRRRRQQALPGALAACRHHTRMYSHISLYRFQAIPVNFCCVIGDWFREM